MKLVVALTLLSAPALAQDPRVIDGDTFVRGDQKISLWGIAAPELDQTCVNDRGNEVPFGQAAMATLMVMLDSLDRCETIDTDRNGNVAARCSLTSGTDFGWLLVSSGYAWDWPDYSGGYYAEAEAVARAAEAGIWQMDCTPPWER